MAELPVSDTSPPIAMRTAAQLVRATLLAALAAAVLLVTVVLPAEYGIDPTGIGPVARALPRPGADGRARPNRRGRRSDGLGGGGDAFHQPDAVPHRRDVDSPWQPGEGAEIKAQMSAGERLVYSWTATGPGVDVDMHGESADGQGGDRSYQTGEFQTARARGVRGADGRQPRLVLAEPERRPGHGDGQDRGLLPAAVPALTGDSPLSGSAQNGVRPRYNLPIPFPRWV